MTQQTGDFDEFQRKLFHKILREGRVINEGNDIGTIPGLIENPKILRPRSWIGKDPCLPID
jgi:hypothetical protein